jgi:tetratricopeptide (TPR) repeat protein
MAQGDRAIARAVDGDGTVLLFHGEPGLGKTRVVQAIAKSAAARGARVVWGRAWEAGGAPPYWPWIQVFRALGAPEDPFRADEMAASPELPQARFAKFDRAARWLKGESAEDPLVVVLDDLHVADLPSLLFLHFLVRDKSASRLLVLGTYREVEARLAADVEPLLTKIAREGEAVALDRLSPEDVLEWICAESGGSAEAVKSDAERVFATTEGNALFVHELLRVRPSRGTTPNEATRAAGLRAILDEHLGRLSPKTRAVLEAGSILGRDLDPSLVATLSGSSRGDVEAALREALALGLVASVSGGESLSFSHILLRERLYAELLPSRRAELHSAAAEAILSAGGDPATATHHLFESSSPSSRVAEVAYDAARAALAGLAFEEAARLSERALAKHTADDLLTTDLELVCGEAQMRIGRVEAGRESCVRAAARARRMGSADGQARAGLTYGIEFAGGVVDPRMVELLRVALDALPDEDAPIRARVLARLASALVPTLTMEGAKEVMAIGAAAVAMARRCGDPETLLYSLYYGASASAYLIPATEFAEMTRELVTLARSLGRPLILLTLGGRWVVTLREQGALAESDAALAEYESLMASFPQPNYQWRPRVLRATLAALSGDFATADALAAEALALAEEAGVLPASMGWALLQFSLAHLRGDPKSIAPHAARIEALVGKILGARGFLTWLHAATGREEFARTTLREVTMMPHAFPWVLIGSEATYMLGDIPLAEAFYPKVIDHASRNSFFWGVFGSMAIGPIERTAGNLARLLGRLDEARRWYEAALAVGKRMGAPAITTYAERALAELQALGPPSAAGEPSAPSSVRGGSTRTASPAGAVTGITLAREGEMWTVTSSTGVVIHLKDSKGLSYLSHLVDRPGQELHVTDLAELSDVSGDAGTVLDAKAKAAYKERLEALREQLEEAQRFGDPARAEAAQAEIDAIADQLAGAVGLGGRDRKMASQVEKVRINVQRRVRDAIQRIEEHDKALGRYLAATVKTGTFCIFSPI